MGFARLPRLASVSVLALALLAPAGLRAHDEETTVYSAASLDKNAPVAPNSIAMVEGDFGDAAVTAPEGEPQVELDGIKLEVEGSDDITMPAALFSVEPTRLRFLLPNLPVGSARLTARRGEEVILEREFQVQATSPGLFSAAASGGGLADGQAEIVSLLKGTRHHQDLAYLDEMTGAYRAVPINPAAEGTVVFLRLRGTGIRYASDLTATVGGVEVPSLCGSESGMTAGIDEVRLGPIPVQLAHREVADIVLVADGLSANIVQVAFTPTAGEWVTFSNQISRLFQEHCQVCHRPGEVAPFSTIEYADVRDWTPSIKQAVVERSMPPWKPVPGHGEFEGVRRLTDEEVEMVASWVDLGAPEGNRSDLPEPLSFSKEWSLGEPDVILETPVYTPDPQATDDYRCFSIPLPDSITESKSITGVEVRPGNSKIVHHTILFGDPVGESVGLEAAASDGREGYECFGDSRISLSGFTLGVESYILGGWAPGSSPQTLPEGVGLYLRRGARLAIQMHYHPDGTNQSDTTRIGLHFAEERTPHNATVFPVVNTRFTIPAGAQDYEVTAQFSLKSALGIPSIGSLSELLTTSGLLPLDIVNVFPHMHLLGRSIRMDKISESGETTPMVYIKDWDFDWQDFYTYVNPVPLGFSDQLVVSAIYDNSAANPRNPHSPPVPVSWGDKTTDEMCLVFFTASVPDLCRLPLGLCSAH